MFDDLSLLQLAAMAEEFVWGELRLDDEERERLRVLLLHRFSQVEALNRGLVTPNRRPPDVNS